MDDVGAPPIEALEAGRLLSGLITSRGPPDDPPGSALAPYFLEIYLCDIMAADTAAVI